MVSAQLDGLIIIDEAGRPIVQSNFRNSSPSYALAHVDAFNHALMKALSQGAQSSLDPVLHFNIPASADRTSSVLCHVERNGLWFLCPVSVEVDPIFVFSFIDTFIQTLIEYLGDISSSLIKDHFDVVYQLLEEMLDDGIPLTTETNTLRDIVLPPSLLNKMLSVAGVVGLPTATPAPFSSPIPWRKKGLRYNNNEIFFDIDESIEAIMSSSGKIVASSLWGKIRCDAKLSGTPDLLMIMANTKAISTPSFHPCVRLQRWADKKELSFVPPDGRFILMEYSAQTPTVVVAPVVPLHIKTSVQIYQGGGSIEIVATSKLPAIRPLESVVITLYLGPSAGSTNFTVTSAPALGRGGIPTGPADKDGSWGFEPQKQTLRWEIPELTPTLRTLKGTFATTDSQVPRIARSINVSFNFPPGTPLSGLKIEQMKVTQEAYKAYKGVRVNAKGAVEWRI
ncbi:Mu homology domain-containing protein [Cantharellus anzutake]|uniref:Mu homology domain-containing protein n=1 Tax=Cantharellus anzutake TaxID=1750568 RepID=UPI00190799ED|nr:Mu homology domain-containing protein [Cantharellus anzutake]KAF8324480.1 Mu homology domain-containing protein [Cantharellus anzutake]